ncbi:cobyrinic acid a,c-diamide synthase [Ktedonobacter racemifer DSM 44963]|uniref:Cobyrinic acid a,c-diamide synthase n=1 Tax=Ktedonobacter racemifer DSM 44963 TaxID=485913 RepID=D6TFN2_KTERA|nr:cobyrinic acid a,c-diamide synthase [Ktedonobacter racemifer DSM 44963]
MHQVARDLGLVEPEKGHIAGLFLDSRRLQHIAETHASLAGGADLISTPEDFSQQRTNGRQRTG